MRARARSWAPRSFAASLLTLLICSATRIADRKTGRARGQNTARSPSSSQLCRSIIDIVTTCSPCSSCFFSSSASSRICCSCADTSGTRRACSCTPLSSPLTRPRSSSFSSRGSACRNSAGSAGQASSSSRCFKKMFQKKCFKKKFYISTVPNILSHKLVFSFFSSRSDLKNKEDDTAHQAMSGIESPTKI